MGQWTITDPDTNESLTVSGDAAPSQQDANDIFAHHRGTMAQATPPTPTTPPPTTSTQQMPNPWGMAYAQAPQSTPTMQSTPQTTQPTQPNSLLGSVASLAGKAGSWLFPGTAAVIKNLSQNLQQPQTGQEVLAGLGGPITSQLFGTQRQKEVNEMGAEFAPMFMGGISPEGFQTITNSIGAPAANLLFRGAGQIAPRTIGAVSSGARAFFNPQEQSLAQRVGSTALASGMGLGTGAAIEGLSSLLEAPMKQGGKMIQRLIHPTPTDITEFTRNTGMNFGDEILKRDGDNISGMNWQQLMDYFNTKAGQAAQVADDTLAKSPETVNVGDITSKIDDQILKLQSQGMAGPENQSAIAALQDAKDTLLGNVQKSGTGDIPVIAANQLKRQFQDSASSAYNLNGTENPSSNAYKMVASWTKNAVKDAYPEIDDINKTTELYKLAQKAVGRRANIEGEKVSNDILGKVLQQAPWLAGLIGLGAGGLPGLGVGLGGGEALNLLRLGYFTPQGTTTLANKFTEMAANPVRQAVSTAAQQGGAYLGSTVAPRISQAIMNMFSRQQPRTVAPTTQMNYGQ